MAVGAELPAALYSVNGPVVVPVAILSLPDSVNQMRLSGPSVIPFGALPAVVGEYSVKVPVVVTLPILLPAASVNHSSPSAPVVIAHGWLAAVGTVYSVIVPV